MYSESIDLPPHLKGEGLRKKLANEPLKYSYWPDAKKICTVSEPFLTPIIQHTLGVIGGYGVPDYPEGMKAILKKILDEFGTIPADKEKIKK